MRIIESMVGPALLAVIGYATTQLKDMSSSIQELNRNMAVVIKTLQVQDRVIETHSGQIKELESELMRIRHK